MLKLVLFALLALVLVSNQEALAFKIVNVHIQRSDASASAAPAPTLPSPNALLQGVTGIINQKLSAVSSLVSNLVQAKLNLKRTLLGSLSSTASTATATATAASPSAASYQRPIFTKTVSFGLGGPAATASSGSSSGGYRR